MITNRYARRTAVAITAGAIAAGVALAVPASASVAEGDANSISAQGALVPPNSAQRVLLAQVNASQYPKLRARIGKAGRYEVEYIGQGDLYAWVHPFVDSANLGLVGISEQGHAYSAPVQLAAGPHSFSLGGPDVEETVNAYLVGPF